jgi:uncharacterized protein YndB with AHSA1/START domain
MLKKENKNPGKQNPGKLTKDADGYRVVFERNLNHSIEVVWDAISNPEKLKIWFTDFEMNLDPGSDIKIIFRDKNKTVTSGKVLEVDPPHKFVWTWEGELAVWELTSTGRNKCRLVLTYSKLTDQYAVGATGGFHTLMDRLEKMLEGSTETYPFGTEENDPVQAELRESYSLTVYDTFPELEAHHPITTEKVFNKPVSLVWDAITNKEKMKQWYFDIPDFNPVVGTVFDWMAGPPGGKQWLHRGRILEVVPERKLAHSWHFPGYVGEAITEWELTKVDERTTKLNFKFKIVIPFDVKEDALRRKNFLQGWTEIIGNSLSAFLEKN